MAASFRSRKRRRSVNAASRRSPRIRAHAWIGPVFALLLLAALIAATVIVSTVTRRHVQLDDGTVWVISLGNRKAARFNVRNEEADAVVSSAAPRFDIAQYGEHTILAEPGRATSIRASTVGTEATTVLDARAAVMMGGDTFAVVNESTGKVWTGRPVDLDRLDTATDTPRMKLGSGGRIAVSHDGRVYGYRPRDGMVLRLDAAGGGKAEELGSLSDGTRLQADGFTVIDGMPVIASGNTVIFPGGSIHVEVTGTLMLQHPPADGNQSGWVAAASARGLALIRLDTGSEPVVLDTGGSGEPAQPVSVNGCVHAAWSQPARNTIRACSPTAAQDDFRTVQSVDETSELVFRVNHRLVVLNDVVNGNVWNPGSSDKAIAIQWNRVSDAQTVGQRQDDDSADTHQDFAQQCSAQSGRIAAEDDEFGARVGSTRILDVLRNDRQTDCSVLTITKVGAPHGEHVTVSTIYGGRYLQLDASAAQAGTATFTYDIADGHGQSSTATVTVTLHEGGNQPPVQTDIPMEIDVEQGAWYTANALGGFTDPDGDPLTVVSAIPQHTDQVQVSSRADGQLTFNPGSLAAGRVGVEITVSDGKSTGTGMMYFSVRPANTLAAIIDPIVASASPGSDTVIRLRPYVHGTSAQPAQLTQAHAPDGTHAAINATDMTVLFRASDPGTYYVPFTIVQGTIPATGLVRVEVRPDTEEAAKPVAADDVALLGADGTAIVEPLANDIDPMGGVLSVTTVSVTDPGITVGLVNHNRVYVTARQMPDGPLPITYTVANAAGTATGTIVLHPPSLTSLRSTPKAYDVEARVRTGGIVSVDVLDHVTYADGTTITVDNDLRYEEQTFQGLAFVSMNTVRYQSGNEPGTFPVIYTVRDTFGNVASATITFTVHRSDAEHKAAPSPHEVEAQVAAGRTVRIPITLTGIDVDGDDDQLLGLGNTAPTLGRVVEVGSDYLLYEAYGDSAGTDVFSYAVEDWTGQRAQATVRVGVFQGASDSGVYARDDEITLRPGTTATVPVTQNDISGDDSELTVDERTQSQGIDGVWVENNAIVFTTPQQATTTHIVYTVRNKAGLSGTATLTVHVDPEADIAPPIAYDYRVPSSSTIDRKSIDVDVSPWISNPSGSPDVLAVSVHASAAYGARLAGGDHSTVITIDLTDQARAVPYTVTNTEHGIASTAFIQVPAYGVFPPTLRPKAPELKVNARSTIDININDYVRVGAGKEPRIESAESISATKSSDDSHYVNDTTLRFTAVGGYAGPASITFTVTDAKRGADASARSQAPARSDADGDTGGTNGGTSGLVNSAVLTLPITIIGRDVPPPTFSSSTIDLEAGAEPITIDLTALTHAPAGLYEDEKQYSYATGTPSDNHITAELIGGGQLRLAATKDTLAGTTAAIPIHITYHAGTVQAGITVRVVVSSRSLARIPDQPLTVKAGSTASVNMLQDAFNPFPDSPLKMVECRADGNATALTISRCEPDGTVAVAAAADTGASVNTIVVTVRDGTANKNREVTGTLTASVIDKPEAPLLSPVGGEPQNGSVRLTWTAGSANGSPITEYLVRWSGATTGEQSCGAVTTCQITGLNNGRTYTFTVAARNEVGWSAPSAAVEAKPDKLPAAPTGVTVKGGNGKATVIWTPVEGNFGNVDNYVVTVTGVGVTQAKETGGPQTSMEFTFSNKDITDGSALTATVRAHNAVDWGPNSDPSEAAPVWGDPDAPEVEIANNGTTVMVRARPTNNRNAGCESIQLHGDVDEAIECNGGTTFTVDERMLNTTVVSVSATVTTKRNASAKSTTARYRPVYAVQRPAQVTTVGRGNTCIVSWTKQGYAQSFIVAADGLGSAETTGTSHEFTLEPWGTCGGASVRQVLNGTAGAPATGAGSPYTYEVPAAITVPTSLAWGGNDHTVTVVNGSVETYGKSATFHIVINGKSFVWKPGQPLDVTGLPVSRNGVYRWSVSVTGNNGLTGLNNTASGGTIRGTRPDAPKPKATTATTISERNAIVYLVPACSPLGYPAKTRRHHVHDHR